MPRLLLASAVLVGALGVTAVALVSADPPATTPVASTPSPTPTSPLPYDVIPSGAGDKTVFAHYFPPFPVSVDNADAASDYYTRNFLAPDGEGGKHAAYGGLLRDRPLPRDVREGADWRLDDMVDEVNEAADAGIDGFTIDILSLQGENWDRTVRMMAAAAEADRDFTVVPNVDVSGTLKTADPDEVAARLAELYTYPSAHRVQSGSYLLSSFAAESVSPEWWSQVMATLSSEYDVPTKFVAVLLSPTDENMTEFAPISYALSEWGKRTKDQVLAAPDRAAKARALGTEWMAPVAVQDARPKSSLYAEAGNTETLRAMWQRAIDEDADMVQLVTWNDYSESTTFAPSVAHGSVFLDISGYYAAWFKGGKAPVITRDAVFLIHRTQWTGTAPADGLPAMAPTLGGAATPPRDAVEVLTMLTTAAVVDAHVGEGTFSAAASAGISASTFPLGSGAIDARVLRDERVVAEVASPFPVSAEPAIPDLQYYAVGSNR